MPSWRFSVDTIECHDSIVMADQLLDSVRDALEAPIVFHPAFHLLARYYLKSTRLLTNLPSIRTSRASASPIN